MWRIILNFTIVVMIYEISGKLTGDHICEIEEKYMENTTEHYLDDITLRNYKWCMSIPPRCSDYTTKKVTKARIVEKESTRLVEKCCPGFVENQNNTFCVPSCPTCINGTCELGKCTCFAGFKGDICDTGCEQTEWGPNCKLKCPCERGICHSATGSCICPSGWTGNRCQDPCPSGIYGDGCLQACQCETNEPCNHVNGKCIPVSTTAASTTVSTEPSTTFTPVTTNPIEKTTNINVIVFENNGKLSKDIKIEQNLSQLMTQPAIIIENHNENHQESVKLPTISSPHNGHHGHQMKDSVDTEEGSYINKTLDNSSDKITKSTAKAKVQNERVDDSNFVPNNNATDCNNNYCDQDDDGVDRKTNDDDDDAFVRLLDTRKKVVVDYNTNAFQKGSKFNLFSNVYALAGIVISIIVISMPIIAVIRIIKRRKKLSTQSKQKDDGNGGGASAMPVFTHNIFDTPLPELPSLENTFMKSEMQVEEGTFGPNPVRHTTFQVQPTDPREYLYDHPPSTGSYRAVSVPEPPGIADIGSVQSAPHLEPVYDEIPSGQLPQPVSAQHPSLPSTSSHVIHHQQESSSLYMNTLAKTRL